jgi:small subunit ribosomal protein S17
MHPVLGKVVRRSKKYHAHSETNEFNTGDTVLIEETRPMSKTKAWKVTQLLEKARVE